MPAKTKLKTVGNLWEKRTVINCSACGKDHKNLVFTKLSSPVSLLGKGTFTDRAKCPKSGKFVYARATPLRKDKPLSVTILLAPFVACRDDIVKAFDLWGSDAILNCWKENKAHRLGSPARAEADTATFLVYLTKALNLKSTKPAKTR